MNHVEDDEHYLADFEDMQDKFEEIQRKYNKLINLLTSGNSTQFILDIIKAEPKEFRIEFEGE